MRLWSTTRNLRRKSIHAVHDRYCNKVVNVAVVIVLFGRGLNHGFQCRSWQDSSRSWKQKCNNSELNSRFQSLSAAHERQERQVLRFCRFMGSLRAVARVQQVFRLWFGVAGAQR